MKRKVAVFLVAAALATAVAASGSATAQQAIGQHDIEVRDQLIADQENLLNTYRCLFGVDVHAVPGGCEDPDTVVAGAAPQSPTQSDLDVRDGLIQSQEGLLNVYRCQYNIDTQLVPGGCAEDGTPTIPEGPGAEVDSFTIPEGPRGDDTLISVGQGRTCAVLVQTPRCGLRS